MKRSMYFPTVDFLRLFAALWVVSVHYFGDTGGGNTFFKYGNLGVPLFFIISGFVISFSVKEKTLKEFALMRFLRLYPLFWFACTLTFLITLTFPFGDHVSLKDFFINLTMLGAKGGAVHLVDNSYWSLAVEVAFYILIGTFVAFFSFARIRIFYTTWIAISFAVFFFNVQGNHLAQFTLARHAPYFIFGGFLALLLQDFHLSKIKNKIIDISGMILASLLAFYVMNYSLVAAYGVKDPKDFWYVLGFNVLFFLLTPIICYYSFHIKKARTVELAIICGGITYPLYLLHQKIGSVIVHNFGAQRTFSFISVLTAIFIILVSYYVYIYEKRLRKFWIKKIQAQSKTSEGGEAISL